MEGPGECVNTPGVWPNLMKRFDMTDSTRESWLAVPGYEGSYEVSDLGRIRSWRPWRGNPVPRVLAAHPDTNGHRRVRLCHEGDVEQAGVHQLVMLAFVGPVPEGMEVLHGDDVKTNNALSNLRYGTRSENMLDRIANGINPRVNQTHCVNGHSFSADNTRQWSRNGRPRRICKTCQREAKRRSKGRRISA